MQGTAMLLISTLFHPKGWKRLEIKSIAVPSCIFVKLLCGDKIRQAKTAFFPTEFLTDTFRWRNFCDGHKTLVMVHWNALGWK